MISITGSVDPVMIHNALQARLCNAAASPTADTSVQQPSKIIKGKYRSIIEARQATPAPATFKTRYDKLSLVIFPVKLRKKATSNKVTPMAPVQSVIVMIATYDNYSAIGNSRAPRPSLAGRKNTTSVSHSAGSGTTRSSVR